MTSRTFICFCPYLTCFDLSSWGEDEKKRIPEPGGVWGAIPDHSPELHDQGSSCIVRYKQASGCYPVVLGSKRTATLVCLIKVVLTGCWPPPPFRLATAGRNHLNEEITPLFSTGLGSASDTAKPLCYNLTINFWWLSKSSCPLLSFMILNSAATATILVFKNSLPVQLIMGLYHELDWAF